MAKVPLIVWSKHGSTPRKNDSLVQWMDIAPTILEAAGVAPPESFEAKSLWPILEGQANQIEYPYEDPFIRERFESELAKRGLKSVMPDEAYKDPKFEWDYTGVGSA